MQTLNSILAPRGPNSAELHNREPLRVGAILWSQTRVTVTVLCSSLHAGSTR